MTIDWMHFTPRESLGGGLLLGVASALFILINGRILGISSILGGLLSPRRGDVAWRLSFLVGMALAPLVASSLFPAAIGLPRIDAGYLTIAGAGLLVGFGTRYGSGCTGGHGVCGLSRLSPRSLVSTLTFMGAGFLMVYLLRHLI